MRISSVAMKKTVIFLVYACVIWFAAACNNDAPSEKVVPEHLLKPLEESTEIVSGIEHFIDSLEIVPIKDTNVALSAISKILVDNDGNLYVLDFGGNIFSFDKHGDNYLVMPEHGRASNEYLRATDICITSNELMVLDEPVVRCFSLDNLKNVRTVSLPAGTPVDAIAPCGDGFYLYSAFSGHNAASDFLLTSCDSDGNQTGRYVQREDVTFSMFNISQSRDNRYFLRPQNSSNIFYLLEDESLKALYKLDFSSRNIPKMYYYNVADENIPMYMSSEYYKLPMELHETVSNLYFRVGGKDAIEESFVYDSDLKYAVRWRNGRDDRDLKIQGSDRHWFYAITPYLDGSIQGDHGAFYTYVSSCFNNIEKKAQSQFYIVKIRFVNEFGGDR